MSQLQSLSPSWNSMTKKPDSASFPFSRFRLVLQPLFWPELCHWRLDRGSWTLIPSGMQVSRINVILACQGISCDVMSCPAIKRYCGWSTVPTILDKKRWSNTALIVKYSTLAVWVEFPSSHIAMWYWLKTEFLLLMMPPTWKPLCSILQCNRCSSSLILFHYTLIALVSVGANAKHINSGILWYYLLAQSYTERHAMITTAAISVRPCWAIELYQNTQQFVQLV